MSSASLHVLGTPLYRAAAPLLVLLILAMMVLPLPPIALDLLFTLNLALAMIVLLVALSARRPLDFSVFPTVLLLATLLRLSLNVASTRLILLDGHTGPDAAGEVIESFGHFLVGGNAAVGFVVFLILVIINFVVITKGAGRIAEVAARFTLDSMPGKQLAVDADLNAGFIDESQARARRADIGREADFYGAMDGASKFVRGDAVAGIVILLVNLIGGVAIGLLQHDMGFSAALARYALLTVGDGLVTQIPALVISTAAGIIVSRASAEQDLSREFIGQVLGQPRLLLVAAAVLGTLGLLPGTPHLAFLGIAALIVLAVWAQQRRAARSPVDATAQDDAGSAPGGDARTEGACTDAQEAAGADTLDWDDLPRLDPLALEVGYRLIPLIDPAQGGRVVALISDARRAYANAMGLIPPPVRAYDAMHAKPHSYRVLLKGSPVLHGEVSPGQILAVDTGSVFGRLDGTPGYDPLSRRSGVWLDASRREHAELRGYLVLDPAELLVRAVSAVIRDYAVEWLGRDAVEAFLDAVARDQAGLIAGVRQALSLDTLQSVLRALLTEQVAVRDTQSLFDALQSGAARGFDADELVAAARVALARPIWERCAPAQRDPVQVLALAPELEAALDGIEGMSSGVAERLQQALRDLLAEHVAAGHAPVLFVPPALRVSLARSLCRALPDLCVLAYSELPPDRRVQVVRFLACAL